MTIPVGATRSANPEKRIPLSAGSPEAMSTRDAARRFEAWIEEHAPRTVIAELFRKKTCAERPDACEPVEEARPELFVQDDPNEVDAIDPRDVKQNRIGDCYLLATLQALAQSPRGRARLREIVREKREASGAVRYAVTFHVPKPFYARGPSLRPVTIEVPARFIDAGAHRTRTKSGVAEVWVAVVEAAYAKLRGGYAAIDGGRCEQALVALTGAPAATTSSLVDLERDLRAQKPICMWFTARSLDPTLHVFGRHAYAVAGVTADADGRRWVQLRNPWGHDHPPPIAIDVLGALGATIAVGA